MLKRFSEFLVALGPWGILLVAFIDSAGLPLSVGLDALVMLLVVKDPSSAVFNVAVAVLGSAAGNIALYFAACKGGHYYLERHVPEARTRRIRDWFHRYGLVTVFVPALIPIPMPMKPFVILSGAFDVHPLAFLLCVVMARIGRYGSEAYLGVKLGEQSGHYLASHRWHLFGLSVALTGALFLAARLTERWRRR
ncbi:MAG: DedA family protein [Acidobacteria bacterium]|nr:DedA family protein [Acidobacteriota bacterium]MBI3469749.1 DedA family protein [Candidatus Solibacter usitatus]